MTVLLVVSGWKRYLITGDTRSGTIASVAVPSGFVNIASMRTREDRTAINGDQRSPTRPVMVRGWAEAVIDVHRAYSRQIQPSNREPISCEGGVPDSIERTS